MIRAVAVSLLLFIASPLFAQKMTETELEALYDKWQAEEDRTLEGWRVLDDITLIEKLSPWIKRKDTGEIAEAPVSAAALLAIMHTRGIGGAPSDNVVASRYFRHAILDSKLSYHSLLPSARFFVSDEGQIVVSPSRAHFGFGHRLVDYGNEVAARALSALVYLSSEAGGRDSREALENLRKAGENGCLPAKVVYARELYRGTHLLRDIVGARKILEEGALADYLPALMERARFHDFYNGVRPDLKLQRELLNRAARAGCMGAAKRLIELPVHELDEHTVGTLFKQYIDGWGRTRVSWTVNLERMLRFEPNPVLAAYTNVAQWLRPIADPEEGAEYTSLQIACARCMLGECLLHGIGGAEPDFDEGISLLRAAWRMETLPAAGLLCGLHLLGDAKADPNVQAPAMIGDVVAERFTPAERLMAFASLDWDRYTFKSRNATNLKFREPKEGIRTLALGGDRQALDWMLLRHPDDKLVEVGAAHGLPTAMLDYASAMYLGNVEGATGDDAEELFRRCLGFPETHEAAKRHLEYERAQLEARRALELIEELKVCVNETGGYRRFLDDNPYAVGVAQRSFEAGHETGVLYALCLYELHGISARTMDSRKILLAYADDPLAVYLCGRQYEDGSDARSAIWCYEAAAGVGAGYAAWRLGTIYRDGKLKDKDDEAATKWFIKGAEDNCVVAMLEAAKAYHGGVGVEEDIAKAKAWAKKAADAGNEDAQALLDEWNK